MCLVCHRSKQVDTHDATRRMLYIMCISVIPKGTHNVGDVDIFTINVLRYYYETPMYQTQTKMGCSRVESKYPVIIILCKRARPANAWVFPFFVYIYRPYPLETLTFAIIIGHFPVNGNIQNA